MHKSFHKDIKMTAFPVKVYIYDLTKGMARQLSMALIGKQLDGVWHTGIVVYDQEFFFGGQGIDSCAPGNTILGQPDQIVDLGTTEIPCDMFFEYLQDLANSTYRPECYHLLDHNCNTFSNELANFLTGRDIPSHITNLPQEVMSTPFGAMIRPFIDSMTVTPGTGSQHHAFTPQDSAGSNPNTSNNASAASKPLSTKVNDTGPSSSQMVQASKEKNNDSFPTMTAFADEQNLKKYSSEKEKFNAVFSPSDVQVLDEIYEFLTTKDCSWGLGRNHIKSLEKMMQTNELSEDLVPLLGAFLELCVLNSDVLQMLKHGDNSLLKLFEDFENKSGVVQQVLLKTLCNICSKREGYEWLVSNKIESSIQKSNRKLVYNVCANCLLHENVNLNRYGAALAFNLTRCKVEDDEAMEVGIALIQLTTKDLDDVNSEKHLLEALAVTMQRNAEVKSVAVVMGMDFEKYKNIFSELSPSCKSILENMHS